MLETVTNTLELESTLSKFLQLIQEEGVTGLDDAELYDIETYLEENINRNEFPSTGTNLRTLVEQISDVVFPELRKRRENSLDQRSQKLWKTRRDKKNGVQW